MPVVLLILSMLPEMEFQATPCTVDSTILGQNPHPNFISPTETPAGAAGHTS
jgi:hypothetical protein